MGILSFFSLVTISLCASAQRIDMNLPAYVMARQTTAPTLSLDIPSATTTVSINPSQISAQLASLLSENPVSQEYTAASVTLGISVPSSLQVAIITAVPGSVLVELMNPAARSSVASDFEAGSTPAWYSSIPPDVKSWFQQFAEEMATGSPVFTVTSTPTPVATEYGGDGTAATGGSVDDDSAPATTSSKALAARPTRADWSVVASAVAFAGVLGIGVAI